MTTATDADRQAFKRLFSHVRQLYILVITLWIFTILALIVACYAAYNGNFKKECKCLVKHVSAVDDDRAAALLANVSASGKTRKERSVQRDDTQHHRHHHHDHRYRDKALRELKSHRRRHADQERGNEEGATPWVPLTSRVSAVEMIKFCQSHCPPGPRGPKGDKGDKGNIGYPGAKGEQGVEGYRGFKGEAGRPGPRGTNGLDGRNGLPGTPGLDGVPGAKGQPGTPGIDGQDGTNGVNGTDGIPGAPGPKGVQGPPGPPGLNGPRGKKGQDGIPGEPGIQTWVKDNGTLLLPAKFPDPSNESRTFREGDHVKLKCIAQGEPKPTIIWQMENSNPIYTGLWKENTISGPEINFTRINREQSGVFTCTASNGLPDPVRKYITLNVLFPPTIEVDNYRVAQKLGHSVVLECIVEMFPGPIKYWLHPRGRIVDPNSRFVSTDIAVNHFRVIMMLNITTVREEDYGEYKCYAKNDLGSKHGIVYLHRPNDSEYVDYKHQAQTAPPAPIIHGEPRPPLVAYEEMCPAQVCPECQKPIDPDIICIGGKRVLVTNVTFNESVEGLPKIKPVSCMMMEIGKPLYHRDMQRMDMAFGAWMKDSAISDEIAAKRVWLIRQDNPNVLYEYENDTTYHDDKVRREIKLKYPFVGNTHLVYNGSFYYTMNLNSQNRATSTNTQVARLDLSKNESDEASYTTVSLFNADINADNYLYSTNHSYVDISADENGLWFIHAQQGSSFTVVRKVNPKTLKTQFAWNLTLNHRNVGEMFIICGVLYAVNNVTSRTTLIQIAYNLYTQEMLELPKLEYTNPFRGTTMISYNARDKELLSWDKGSQLSYPLILRVIEKDDILPLPPQLREQNLLRK